MGNTPSAVPFGAQIGFLNTSVVCSGSYNGVAQPPFYTTLQVSATAPLQSNVQFNYTDIHVSLATGGSPYQLIVDTQVTFATNATPATFTLSSEQFNNGSLNTAEVPTSGVTTSGLISVGSSPAQLNVTQVHVKAFNADITYDFTCVPPRNIILTTGSGKSAASSNAPANGFRSKPVTPINSTTNIANVPLSCGGPQYGLILGGTAPSFVKANTQFLLSNVNAFFSFFTTTDTAYALTLGKTTSGSNVGGLTAELAGSVLSQVDIARDFTASDPNTSNPLSGGAYTDGTPQNLTLALPHYGFLSKNFTSTKQVPFSVALTHLQGTLNTNSNAQFISCTVGANRLLSVPII